MCRSGYLRRYGKAPSSQSLLDSLSLEESAMRRQQRQAPPPLQPVARVEECKESASGVEADTRCTPSCGSYLRRFGRAPASQSLLDSLSLDGSAIRGPRRPAPPAAPAAPPAALAPAREETVLASQVLFDALALTSVRPGQRRRPVATPLRAASMVLSTATEPRPCS
mmetsp:Transcript_29294/g.68107  ORF Transcript_29294/g.68107 Transcript_29294/m.68107 type:complete len:167 (+) Transcript_29294:81-581(+)